MPRNANTFFIYNPGKPGPESISPGGKEGVLLLLLLFAAGWSAVPEGCVRAQRAAVTRRSWSGAALATLLPPELLVGHQTRLPGR